ncbi:uracil-DNA glycosylase [Pelagibacterium luteolum]|uniref:Type-4 uracil-DNA glycosylase n=1 Tax=Pelagibacterium luteolum TaxID=440168 RepID=A0A1G7TWU0_9HYPH|nr:uracil-DNA glycosylase [Pelagibacterium luteolum]SDG39698.1 DNA polymerase [Pelagibacterium luteolum]
MANRQLNREEMLAALDWYVAAGIDVAVGEDPVDRFAQAATLATPSVRKPLPGMVPQTQAARPAPSAPVATPTDTDPDAARALASSATSLEALREMLETFDGCGLKLRATNLVFADGNPDADIMFVGEAPGRDEDLQGKPFVGRSGQLLDRMLKAIGLDRTKVYIANTVPWRPPGNRAPSPAEISVCLPFLYRQIELVAPKVLVALGGASASTLFETDTGITRLRGQWRDLTVSAHSMRAVATLHPAYLLRQPAAKALAWQDLLSIKAELGRL